MAYKVAIDAYRGGNDIGASANNITEKDFNLNISKYINERLNKLGIENFLVRDSDATLTDDERINIIKNKYGTGNNIIVISNRLNSGNGTGLEIMYPLRNNSKLASSLATSLENSGANVTKFYQFRNSDNPAVDEDYLIRNTPNNQTIVIDYGYPSNNSDASLLNNYENLGEAVVKAIADYTGTTYYPVSGTNYYIVKKGDSLWSIASKNNTTVDVLKKLNNLSSNTLSIGQYLKLPQQNEEEASPNNVYVVQKGDSLWSIANKFNITVDNLKSYNSLSSNLLSIGQVLQIPSEDIPTNQIIYTVKKGDSLWAIANKYDTTVDMIKSTNNLTSNNLSIDQKLIIPSTTNYITYIVKAGDNLYSIARNYNTTVDSIKKLNNLSSNTLSIGQKLIITA